MSFVEILLIAVSLCFDTLAVSIIGGACLHNITLGKRVKIYASFAVFQAGFTFTGWYLGASVSQYISKFDHWIAFILLLYIGGRMILDTVRHKDESEEIDLLNTGKLILSSIATSIDALAVGLSFAMAGMMTGQIIGSVITIGIVTALSSIAGLRGGERLGAILGKKCNIIGGVILIAIGVKIVLEHLLF